MSFTFIEMIGALLVGAVACLMMFLLYPDCPQWAQFMLFLLITGQTQNYFKIG